MLKGLLIGFAFLAIAILMAIALVRYANRMDRDGKAQSDGSSRTALEPGESRGRRGK